MSNSKQLDVLSETVKNTLDAEEIEGMRNAILNLMQFCVSDDSILQCLDSDTCFYAISIVRFFDNTIK